MEYKQKLMLKVIGYSLVIIAMIAMAINVYIEKIGMHFSGIFSVMVLFFSTIIIIAVITDYKKNKVILNDKCLILNKPKGLLPVETKLNWQDVTIIRCYGKIHLIKELYICTKYKSISIKISRYKHYKELLRTIIEKTESNENIKIEQDVYDLIKQ